jgi:hypothetical protein
MFSTFDQNLAENVDFFYNTQNVELFKYGGSTQNS